MSMPQGGESGQPWDTGEHLGEPEHPWQGSTSSQRGGPSQGGVPGQGGVPSRGSGATNAVLLRIGAVLVAAWYFWYWVYRPYRANGRSFGMQILGLRIISLDGGRASKMQLFIRAILLIIDTFVWGLVGFLTIIFSRYRQRVGDHAAKTLVVRARAQTMPATREYAGAGQAGFR